jgi:hypothetical protein
MVTVPHTPVQVNPVYGVGMYGVELRRYGFRKNGILGQSE